MVPGSEGLNCSWTGRCPHVELALVVSSFEWACWRGGQGCLVTPLLSLPWWGCPYVRRRPPNNLFGLSGGFSIRLGISIILLPGQDRNMLSWLWVMVWRQVGFADSHNQRTLCMLFSCSSRCSHAWQNRSKRFAERSAHVIKRGIQLAQCVGGSGSIQTGGHMADWLHAHHVRSSRVVRAWPLGYACPCWCEPAASAERFHAPHSST